MYEREKGNISDSINNNDNSSNNFSSNFNNKKNNPIESAKEAVFKEDVRAFQDELNMKMLEALLLNITQI